MGRATDKNNNTCIQIFSDPMSHKELSLKSLLEILIDIYFRIYQYFPKYFNSFGSILVYYNDYNIISNLHLNHFYDAKAFLQ